VDIDLFPPVSIRPRKKDSGWISFSRAAPGIFEHPCSVGKIHRKKDVASAESHIFFRTLLPNGIPLPVITRKMGAEAFFADRPHFSHLTPLPILGGDGGGAGHTFPCMDSFSFMHTIKCHTWRHDSYPECIHHALPILPRRPCGENCSFPPCLNLDCEKRIREQSDRTLFCIFIYIFWNFPGVTAS